MKPLAPGSGRVPHSDIPAYRPGLVGVDAPASVPLHVVLRADAGRTQGTGHVMRILTLAEGLVARGHRVTLATAEIDIPWLAEVVTSSGVDVVASARDEIDVDAVVALGADRAVVDSYLIPAASITALDARVPVLLIADGDSRGAEATWYLDQNLGAATLPGVPESRQLRGAAFALVRRAILAARRPAPTDRRHDPPEVLVVLGGTDPGDRTVDVARACAGIADRASFTFVAPDRQHAAIAALGDESRSGDWRVAAPTPRLPALFAHADAVVSAGGTSAWDVATLGIPSVLLAVVDNQQASLAAAAAAGVAVGFDVVAAPPDRSQLAAAILAVVEDDGLRARLVEACARTFDGLGVMRVIRALEDGAEPHGGREPA